MTDEMIQEILATQESGRILLYIGIFFGLSLSCIGAVIGTTKVGVGFYRLAVSKYQNMSRYMTHILMPGIVGLYGLIASIIFLAAAKTKFNFADDVKKLASNNVDIKPALSWVEGMGKLSAGAALGLSCLASGWAIGLIGEVSLKSIIENARLFTISIVVMVFGEVIGLYTLILAIMV